MVPPPSGVHRRFGSDLLVVLSPLARERGLQVSYETGFFRRQDDYRVPDLAVYRDDQTSHRGAEGAELVIEIRSPSDESLAKVPWYLAQGCPEVLIIDRDSLELHSPTGRIEPAHSEVLGCAFTTVDGPGVRVEWSGGQAVVRHR